MEDEELKKLREQRDALRRQREEEFAAARERQAEIERLKAEIALEEQRLRDEPEIDKAIAEHGPLNIRTKVIETPAGAVVIKRPNHLHFRKFQDKGDSIKTADVWDLVRTCIAYPDVKRVDKICEDYPGVLMELANAVSDLAGVRRSEVAPK